MNYQVIKTDDELRKAIEILTTQPVVGLDTETTELDPFTSRLRLIQLAASDRVFILDFNHTTSQTLNNYEIRRPLVVYYPWHLCMCRRWGCRTSSSIWRVEKGITPKSYVINSYSV